MKITFISFDEWKDFLVLSRNIRESDLIVFAAARKGFVSYKSVMRHVVTMLDKYFSGNNRILVYPQQRKLHYKVESYEMNTTETIDKGIETVQSLGKNIGKIFSDNSKNKTS